MGTEGTARGGSIPREPVKSTPDQYPVATPPGLQAADHSWVLQTVMELQKSVGGLTQAVATLTEQVRDQGAKLDAVRQEVTEARTFMKTAAWLLSGIKTAAKTAAWLLGGIVALLGGIVTLITWFVSRHPPIVTAILETIRAGQE